MRSGPTIVCAAPGQERAGGHDEREQPLNQLLSEMDGFDPYEEVIVMAATNRPGRA